MGRTLGPCQNGQQDKEQGRQQAQESGNGGGSVVSRLSDSKDPLARRVGVTVIIALLTIDATIALEKFSGWESITQLVANPWYRVFIISMFIVLLVAWLRETINYEPFGTVGKVLITLSVVMMILFPCMPDANVKSVCGRLGRSSVPAKRVVFDHTYTYADAFEKEHGQFYSFDYIADGIQRGDMIDVTALPIGKTQFEGDEVWVATGDPSHPWVPTVNGKYGIRVEHVGPGKFAMSLGGRKDVKVEVKVIRG